MEYILEFKQNQSNSLVSNFTKRDIEIDVFNQIRKRKLQCRNINKKNLRIKAFNHKEGKWYNNRKIVIEDFFSDSMRVEDVHRYNLKIRKGYYPKLIPHSKNDIVNSKFNDCHIKVDENENSIVFLLESPHKDEYDEKSNTYEPIAPAQGKTGKRIEENICIVINELICNHNLNLSDGKYRIIICNPVQYQSSLYYLHGKGISSRKIYSNLRNEIWYEIFNQCKIQADFKNRINSYNPKLILNSCTNECKKEVAAFINTNFPTLKYYETSHPSTWGNFNIK